MFERLTDRTGNGQVYLIEGPEEDMHGYYTGKGLKQIEKVIDRLAAYEDSGLSPEQIQAQQQEIERLNKVLDDWKYNAKCDADHIAGLLADKDEQDGRKKQYDAVLKQARKALKTCEEIASSEKNQLFWTADVAQKSIKAIDALLGGKEDEK